MEMKIVTINESLNILTFTTDNPETIKPHATQYNKNPM